MNSIAIILLIIAIELALIVVAVIVSFAVFIRKTKGTLEETQNLVKSLEDRVNELSNEIKVSLKNTTEATEHLKKTLNNTEKATAFLNSALPIISLVLLWRGITVPLPSGLGANNTKRKNGSIISTISNIGKWAAAVGQGYALYKKFKSKGGKRNG